MISQNNKMMTRAKPVTEIQRGPSVNIEIKPAAPARVRRNDCQIVRLSLVVVLFSVLNSESPLFCMRISLHKSEKHMGNIPVDS